MLKPGERALGNADEPDRRQPRHGARAADRDLDRRSQRLARGFIVTGVLGLAWIPLWRAVGQRCPSPRAHRRARADRDRRLWSFVAANALSMHSLLASDQLDHPLLCGRIQPDWRRLPAYAWIPPGFARSADFSAAGVGSARARGNDECRRAGRSASALRSQHSPRLVPRLRRPHGPPPAMRSESERSRASAASPHALPLDIFGESRAAFSISLLVSTYGATTAIASIAMGWTRDH